MKLVGLTGGIATGKSSASAFLREEGLQVLDADLLAHSVTRKGRWGFRRVLAAFGPAVLRPDGELDRAALAALVFRDPAQRHRLDAATHLPVAWELLRRILAAWLRCRPVLVVDMPLLFETGFSRVTRPTILVACSPDVQLQRLQRRNGLERAAAEARIAAQMPLADKRRLADVVLENDGGLQELRQQVRQLARRLRRRAWLHRCLLSPPGLLAAAAAAAALWAR